MHIRYQLSGWPSGLRRQTQVCKLAPLKSRQRAFSFTNVGVGSNPTPDRKILKLFGDAIEYIGAVVNPEEDYKLVETLTINQNVIRCYCYFVFC